VWPLLLPKWTSVRIWDAIDGNLVEREVSGTVAQSRVLLGHWVIVDDAALGPTLRLSHDALGANLYLTASESAEARVRELEAELGRRGT